MAIPKGNFSGRQTKPIENDTPFDVSTVQIPDWVYPEGRQFLEKLLPDLIWIIQDKDLNSLYMLANSYALIRRIYNSIQQDGLMVVSDRGKPMKNPLLQALRDQINLFQSLAAKFGLTPSDRARMIQQASSNNSETDPMMELLAKMNQ